MVSPLPPPNYPPSPEQLDPVPVQTESVDKAEEPCQQDLTEDITVLETPCSTAVDKDHSSSVQREDGMESVDEAEESCQQEQVEDLSLQGTPSSTAVVDKNHSSSAQREVEMEVVERTRESCKQSQREEDISIIAETPSPAITVNKAHSSSLLTAPASLEQVTLREISSTAIARPKTKVNKCLLFSSLTHSLLCLPCCLPLSFILVYLHNFFGLLHPIIIVVLFFSPIEPKVF